MVVLNARSLKMQRPEQRPVATFFHLYKQTLDLTNMGVMKKRSFANVVCFMQAGSTYIYMYIYIYTPYKDPKVQHDKLNSEC